LDILNLQEADRTLTYRFEDLLLYHGPGSPGGVAHAFKVLEVALPKLAQGPEPVQRRDIRIETAFPGPGARDAFEMATRCVSEGRYLVDLNHPDAPPALPSPRGFYFFRLCFGQRQVDCRVRPGLVHQEFIDLSRKTERNAADEVRLIELKWEMTERLLALPADKVYDAVVSAG